MLVNALRIDETSAEESVVPVEDDCSLVRLGLLHRCEPDLLVGKFTKQILSKLVALPVATHVVQSETFLSDFFFLWFLSSGLDFGIPYI